MCSRAHPGEWQLFGEAGAPKLHVTHQGLHYDALVEALPAPSVAVGDDDIRRLKGVGVGGRPVDVCVEINVDSPLPEPPEQMQVPGDDLVVGPEGVLRSSFRGVPVAKLEMLVADLRDGSAGGSKPLARKYGLPVATLQDLLGRPERIEWLAQDLLSLRRAEADVPGRRHLSRRAVRRHGKGHDGGSLCGAPNQQDGRSPRHARL